MCSCLIASLAHVLHIIFGQLDHRPEGYERPISLYTVPERVSTLRDWCELDSAPNRNPEPSPAPKGLFMDTVKLRKLLGHPSHIMHVRHLSCAGQMRD